MFIVKAARVLGLIALLAGIAAADSISLNNPVVNGVITGTSGNFFLITATITPTTPLVLGDLNVNEPSGADCSVVCVDYSVYYSQANNNNFYTAEYQSSTPLPANVPTTGVLMTLSFGAVSQDTIVEVDYAISNIDGSGILFQGSFDAIDEPVGAPEPATFAITGLALGIAAAYQCRRARLTQGAT